MAEFLTTHKTASYIEDIIMKAEAKLVLVSPYLDLSETLFNRLKDADSRNIKIVLLYGKDKLSPERKAQLKELDNLSVFFCKELHAKCYFNENTMVITSMNMYEFSEKNNREMGVLITMQDDALVFNEASEEVESILRASQQEDLQKSKPITQQYNNSKVVKKARTRSPAKKVGLILSGLANFLLGFGLFLFEPKGYCIRCRKTIRLNGKKPLCDTCYSKWVNFKNPNYLERYCHKCGKKRKTTVAKPLCRSCFSGIS
jgi:hypothetical protein